jgi:hypothetical protein
VNSAQLDKLTPWPLHLARPYQPDYLAGYTALRYEVEPESGLQVAQGEMAKAIDKDCRRSIGGDEQRVSSVQTRYSDVMFKLMLLPVWIAAYLYAGKTWQVLVNAHTGEVVGQRPYSVWKIAAAILVGLIVVAAVIVAFGLGRRH